MLPEGEGKARPFCGTRPNTRIWCNMDPCGIVCVSLTWTLLLFGSYTISFVVILPWLYWTANGVFQLICFNALIILAFVSHVKAMTTDPGAVPDTAVPLEGEDWRRCARCDAFKPARAHHCSVCGRCVIKMDHHCPWMNNCVGLKNHKYFLLFLLYVTTSSVYGLVLIAWRFAACGAEERPAGVQCFTPAGLLMVVGALVQALLFGLFTTCMMYEQYTTVATGNTGIDRLKRGGARKRAMRWSPIAEVFGGTGVFDFMWLIPTKVCYMQEESMCGYADDPLLSPEERQQLAASLSPPVPARPDRIIRPTKKKRKKKAPLAHSADIFSAEVGAPEDVAVDAVEEV